MNRLAIVMLSVTALLGQGKPRPEIGQGHIVQPQKPGQRYVALNFGMGENYGNFLWVVDTETGKVDSYRVAAAQDKGVHKGFVLEKIQTAGQYDGTQKLWDDLVK